MPRSNKGIATANAKDRIDSSVANCSSLRSTLFFSPETIFLDSCTLENFMQISVSASKNIPIPTNAMTKKHPAKAEVPNRRTKAYPYSQKAPPIPSSST